MAYLRDRRAFGNIGTRKFRGARFGDPLSPRGPQYTKEGLILDYSTDVGPFTIIDQSGQDNTATLYSGRGLTMDAVGDTVTYATGYSFGLRTATLWGRFNTTSPVALVGSVSGFFLFTPTATGVWEELTSTATVEGDLAWDLGLDFDIGDLRVGTEHWTHNDWSNPAGNTSNGKTIVDSGPNGYHGVCTGCSGFTGEATIPQTADRNWNKYFSGSKYVPISTASVNRFVYYFTSLVDIDKTVGYGNFGQVGVNTADRALWLGLATGNATDEVITISVGAGRTVVQNITIPAGHNKIEWVWNSGSSRYDCYLNNIQQTVAAGANGHVFQRLSFSSADAELTGERNGAWYLNSVEVYDSSDVLVHSYISSSNADQTGSVDLVDKSNVGVLVSASDANDQIDALGNAILEPRLNTQQLNLFGDGEYSRTPDSDSLDVTTEATWELWGNFYGVPVITNAWLVSKFDFGSPQRSWGLNKNSNQAADVVRLLLSGNGTTTIVSLISGIPDQVGMLSVTYDAGSLNAYFNGVAITVGTTSVTSIHGGTADVLLSGNLNNGVAGEFYDDKIGSAKIYNRALTADEVLTNYDTQKSLYFNVFPFTLT